MVAVLLLAGALLSVVWVGGEGVWEVEAEAKEGGVEAGVDCVGDVVAEDEEGDEEDGRKESGTDQQEFSGSLASRLLGLLVPTLFSVALSSALNRFGAFDLAPHTVF